MLKLKDDKKPGRNEPCPCGSGLKHKFCHGDFLKQEVCNRVANETMVRLIYDEKIKKGLICQHGVSKNKFCKDCKVGD